MMKVDQTARGASAPMTAVAKRFLLCALVFALIFGQWPAPAAADEESGESDTIVLLPTDDAMISGSNPGNNYGSDIYLEVAGNNANERIIYLKFDLADVDLTDMQSGVLRLYNNDTRYERIITAYETDNNDTAWSESDLTWNNAPAIGPAILATEGGPATVIVPNLGTTADTREQGAAYYELDVFSYLDQADENSLLSIIVHSNGYTRFASKEAGDGALAPQLVLKPSQSIVLTAVDDSYISSSNTATSYGGGAHLEVAGNNANERIIYLKFDLGAVGDISEYKQGLLRLYNNDTRYNRTITAYEAQDRDTSWSESTLNWSNAPELGSAILTGDGVPATADIQSAGVGTTEDVREVGADYIELDVLGYLDQADENGLLTIIVHSNGYTRFASKENQGGQFAPHLFLNKEDTSGPVDGQPGTIGEDGYSALYPADWYPGFGDEQGRFLHDFSYAGYRMGAAPIPDQIPGVFLDVTEAPYSADNTGADDVTTIIQQAINDAGDAGGGVVFLPEGTYRIKPQGSNNESLRISKSGVVLRGAGPDQTFLFNDEPIMRFKDIIAVTSEGNQFLAVPGTDTPLRIDLPEPTVHIPVQDVSPFEVGDWIAISNSYTAEFIAEHDMTGWWNFYEGNEGIVFYRQIVAIDEASGTLTIDIPTRYPLKTRDFSKAYKLNPPVTEVGVEHLAIGNVENLTPGLAEGDNVVEGTAGFQVAGNKAIRFIRVADAWARNVHSYRPPTNSAGYDYHILSSGITTSNTRNVTIVDTDMRKPLYRGAGGNGYLYELVGNDNLILNAYAEAGRHNYTFSHMRTSGNVISGSTSRNPSLVIDFHQYLSASNLLDNMILDGDRIEASVRPYPSDQPNYKHGVTTSQTVVWNTTGIKAHSSLPGIIVDSRQFGHGYVIGTQGNDTGVRVTPTLHSGRETAPVDFVEGIGQGALLQPQSLHLDQMEKRAARTAVELSTLAWNGNPISAFQPGKLNYSVVLPYGTTTAPQLTASAAQSEAVVTITQAGGLPGTATVQVTSGDGGTSALYTVHLSAASSPAYLEHITLLPDRSQPGWKQGVKLDSGTVAWLQVTGMISDGTEADLGSASIAYTSDNTDFLTVTAAGRLTAVSPGTANIAVRVELGAVELTRTIEVTSSIPVMTERDTIPIVHISSSGDDGNVVGNVLDSDYDTRWSASGEGQWAIADLGETQSIEAVSIAFYNGHTRKSIFELQVSVDGETWTTVYERADGGNSSGETSLFELFELDGPQQARYVKYLGYGNNLNAWNSITEWRIHPVPGDTGGNGDNGGNGSHGGNGGNSDGTPTENNGDTSVSVTKRFPGTTGNVLIESDLAVLEAPGDWLTDDESSGKADITFLIANADSELKEQWPDRTRRAIGGRPVIDIRILVNGEERQLGHPGQTVTVRIPYEPSEEELSDPDLLEKLTVWRIDDDGNVLPIPNAVYDATSGSVVFKTTQLSRFAIVLEERTFIDAAKAPWAQRAIDILASRGIINGVSDTSFAPSDNIRRADFTKLLIHALGLSAQTNGSFTDIREADYFAAEVAIAAELGIITGFADGTFQPAAEITRQDLMVILARALRLAGKLETAGMTELDSRFADADEISPYAREAIAALAAAGLVEGHASLLNPKSKATRAGAAVLLYRILML